jgi:signal transduction histidine kinase
VTLVKRPLLVVAFAVVLPIAIRVLLALWVWPATSPLDERQFARYLGIETVADIAVWAAAGGAIVWLIQRAARGERDQRRLGHFAEVALLAGGLAHEIRNHLNVMGTCISLVRKSVGAQDRELLERIEKLDQAAGELDELVTNFLTLARPAKDKLEPIELSALAAEVAEFLSLDLEQSHVEVRLEATPGVPPVIGDRGKLRRVIMNLLVNARQAMPEGGEISVRVRSSGTRVYLDVEDTGCGIPPEDKPRVFEAFFSTKSEGTGLGLAVVKRTIQDLGGTINFESEVGRGTAFHIALPTAGRRKTTMRQLDTLPPQTAGAAQ